MPLSMELPDLGLPPVPDAKGKASGGWRLGRLLVASNHEPQKGVRQKGYALKVTFT